MRRLVLLPRHVTAIERHARAVYPEECCGILIGSRRTDDGRSTLVEGLLPARNVHDTSRDRRYLIDPEVLAAAQKEARGRGLEIVGYYHSHPDRPARPSRFDRDHAWPDASYVIVSVDRDGLVELTSWRRSQDGGELVAEEVVDPAGRPLLEPVDDDRSASG